MKYITNFTFETPRRRPEEESDYRNSNCQDRVSHLKMTGRNGFLWSEWIIFIIVSVSSSTNICIRKSAHFFQRKMTVMYLYC